MSKLEIVIVADNLTYSHNPATDKIRTRWDLCEVDEQRGPYLKNRGYGNFRESDPDEASFVRDNSGR